MKKEVKRLKNDSGNARQQQKGHIQRRIKNSFVVKMLNVFETIGKYGIFRFLIFCLKHCFKTVFNLKKNR